MPLFGGSRKPPGLMVELANALYAIRPWIAPEIRQEGKSYLLGMWFTAERGRLFFVDQGEYRYLCTQRDAEGNHEILRMPPIPAFPAKTPLPEALRMVMDLIGMSLQADAQQDGAHAKQAEAERRALIAEGWIEDFDPTQFGY